MIFLVVELVAAGAVDDAGIGGVEHFIGGPPDLGVGGVDKF